MPRSLPEPSTSTASRVTIRWSCINVMKAKKKPLEEIDATSLGVALEPTLQIVSTLPPSARKPGSKVETVAELVDKLKNEARVI